MTTTRPEPWHRVVHLKDELRSGELTLAEFAADLHEVTLGQGTRPIYEDPARFFALTYPTHALRELEGHRIQDLADLVPELIEASAGYQLKFRIQMVLDDAPEDVRRRAEQLINIRLESEPGG